MRARRYSVVVQLDSGAFFETSRYHRVDQAVDFAERFTESQSWWQVVDLLTEETVAASSIQARHVEE